LQIYIEAHFAGRKSLLQSYFESRCNPGPWDGSDATALQSKIGQIATPQDGSAKAGRRGLKRLGLAAHPPNWAAMQQKPNPGC
jgi:hypothetical protein